MADRIPLCGIDAYMDGMVREHAPGNWVAPVAQWFRSEWSSIVCVLVLGGLTALFWHLNIGFLMPSGPPVLRSFLSAGLLVGSAFLVPQMLSTALAREPGEWNIYSVSEFVNAYDTIHPQLEAEVSAIRAKDPLAEFELYVLHPEGKDAPVGIILFRVDDLRATSTLGTEEPIRIFNGEGQGLEFAEAYVPAGGPIMSS